MDTTRIAAIATKTALAVEPRMSVSASPAVEVVGLTKRYGSGALALDGLSFSVRQGEIFGFLGPNGAGKTTAIRLLLDLIRPTAGSARIFGLDCQTDATAVHARVGYLPGELALYGGYTGRRLIKLLSDLRPGTVDPAYVAALCERLGAALDTPIGQLSHGNKQKIGLVAALMGQPDLVILDEPSTGLDPLVQVRVLEILDEVRAEGRTVFFSSHNLAEVERICDRVAIIRQGKLAAVEAIEDLTAHRQQRVRITFAEPVPGTAFASLGGVEVVEHVDDGKRVLLAVSGDIDGVVKAIAPYHSVTLEAEQPSLEEAFLALYDNSRNEAEAGDA